MGYVYIAMESDCGSFIKIGFTSNSDIRSRIKQLQTGNRRRLDIVGIFELQNTEMARQVEGLLHKRLERRKISGEWYMVDNTTKHVIESLKSLCEFYNRHQVEDFLRDKGVICG